MIILHDLKLLPKIITRLPPFFFVFKFHDIEEQINYNFKIVNTNMALNFQN